MKIIRGAPFSWAVFLVLISGVLCRLAKISNNQEPWPEMSVMQQYNNILLQQ